MSFIASLPAGSQTWLLNSQLAPHLNAFAAHLADGGYSAQTTRNHFLGVAHFARWMTQCALPVSLLDERSVQQFLGIHLSHCSCPPPALSDPSKHRSSLGHLMVVLRRQGVVAEVPPAIGPIPDELRRFDEHMRNARGLSEGTRRGCLRLIERLLLHKFAGEELVFAKLQPEDLRKFIAIQLGLLGSGSNAMSLASALRTYFGYRTICGDQVHGLLGVISAPAHWRLASLPRGLCRMKLTAYWHPSILRYQRPVDGNSMVDDFDVDLTAFTLERRIVTVDQQEPSIISGRSVTRSCKRTGLCHRTPDTGRKIAGIGP